MKWKYTGDVIISNNQIVCRLSASQTIRNWIPPRWLYMF